MDYHCAEKQRVVNLSGAPHNLSDVGRHPFGGVFSYGHPVSESYLWGSEDWFDAYDRRTPNVESSFGNLRQPGKQHMARGRIMVMGRAKVSLLLTFQVAAMNIRLTDAYLRTSVKKVSSRVRKKTNGQPVVRRRRAVPYAARKPTSAVQKRARGRSSPQLATA